MVMIWCGIFGQKILETSCDLKKDPKYLNNIYCKSCPQYAPYKNDLIRELKKSLGADKEILKEERKKKPKATKKLPKKQFKKSYLKYSEENAKILGHFLNYIGEYDLKEVFPIENEQDTLGKEIHKILSEVPLILSLHYSFWENPLFLEWQILRLNKKYQETTLKIWGPLINWIEQEIPGGLAGFDPSEPNPQICVFRRIPATYSD